MRSVLDVVFSEAAFLSENDALLCSSNYDLCFKTGMRYFLAAAQLFPINISDLTPDTGWNQTRIVLMEVHLSFTTNLSSYKSHYSNFVCTQHKKKTHKGFNIL